MARIGVFVCWCGLNIAGSVDVDKVAKDLAAFPGVQHAVDYKYLCSDPGQELVRSTISEYNLDGVVIAACSPSMHEETFQRVMESCGLNPYRLEIANIREQCSWVHKDDKRQATEKAIELVRAAVRKAIRNEALTPSRTPILKRALVIGAGIAGIQASLDIADAGYEVVLVEKKPYIGGHMAQLSETFPTLDCSQCILTPRTAQVARHPRIKLHTMSEVEEVRGYVGNFSVKIRREPAFVNWEKCTGCGLCTEKCPARVSSEFERGLGMRPAISIAFPQAVPCRPVIDKDACRRFRDGKCGVCIRVCPLGAVDFAQEEGHFEERVGAIVVATGYDLYPKEKVGEYGYGKYSDVIDGLQFERLNSASGPTAGMILRPSDGHVPKEVVFIQCVGSRDPEKGYPYCSKICCVYTAKHARLYKHKVPDGQAYVFYMDIRAGGKGYEEFVQRGVEEDGVFYLRGRVSRVFQDGDKLIVWGVDTLSGRKVEIAADMVVLAAAIVPHNGAPELARRLRLSVDEYGFLNEAHPKLRPVETLTRGVFIAGCAQGPKDIPETVVQAGSAASKVLGLFSSGEFEASPLIAAIEEDLCRGCGVCVEACPYEARELDLRRKVARVREALCEGCGACVAACPNGATRQRNLAPEQVFAMVDEVV